MDNKPYLYFSVIDIIIMIIINHPVTYTDYVSVMTYHERYLDWDAHNQVQNVVNDLTINGAGSNYYMADHAVLRNIILRKVISVHYTDINDLIDRNCVRIMKVSRRPWGKYESCNRHGLRNIQDLRLWFFFRQQRFRYC